VSVGERGRRTWRERCIREAAAQAPARVGKGRGKGICGRWASSAGCSLDGLGRRPQGRKVKQADGAAGSELKRNSLQNKNWIFEFTKALEICTRRFRRNFDTRIFPKFFDDPQGF
jgi:hypothetical protein